MRFAAPLTPDPPASAAANIATTSVLFQPFAFATGVRVTTMSGAFLSILLPPTGPALAQFVMTSQTVRLPVRALAVWLPAGTDVASLNDWAAASANPDPPSVAVQVMFTSAGCH